MKVSVIILNYNAARTIDKCLKSVFNSSIKDLEVIVVDNASSDNSLDLIKKYKVKLIKNKKNYGFAEGNNIGIRKAKGKYIFLVNQDAYLDKNCLNYLIKIIEQKDVGVVGPRIKYYKTNKLWSGGCKVYYGGFVNHHYLNNKKGYCDYVSGCAMLIKKEVLKKVGLFDKKYYLYYEEADLCRRIRNAGYKVFYEPKAIVYHDVKEAKRSSYEVYYMNKNRVYYWLKQTKFKGLFLILDFFILYPLFISYQIFKNLRTLLYLKEIIRARIDSLK